LKCVAETDADINVEEFNCLMYSLVDFYFYLCKLYHPFAMEQTRIYPLLHQGLQ